MRIVSSLAAAGVFSLSLSALLLQGAVPFVLPWNDALPGPTDLSGWNSPIGPEQRVAVNASGHFEVRGQRVRFLGVNFAGDSPFMPTNKADAVAARVAKFGVNCVRFHHLDAPWALNGGLIHYGAGNSRNLQASQLDRLQFLIARLKSRGVYANLNLLVGREFKRNDGLPAEVEAMDWKDQHILACFYDPALDLHKEYATKLLTPVNRHTGLSLAQDPAVAFVEILNENGMVQKWLEGALDRLPAVFVSPLQARWNDWLAARYPNDAALLAAWKAVDEPLGPNLVRNGRFTNSLAYWTQEEHGGANANFTVAPAFTNAGPAAKIEVVTPGTEAWHVQLNQPGLALTAGHAYTISFWAKADRLDRLDVSVMQAHSPWGGLGYAAGVALSTNWQAFAATFQATATDANARPNFGGFATHPVSVWIADVSLQKGGRIGGLPPGAGLATRNVPIIPRDAASWGSTEEARRDWVRFLIDLENRYWGEMTRHVRDSCGYPGLVFGTILANSPPNVQARLDVVDGHAYWQHPQFPGQPWDPVNWTVANVSMVNTLGDDNTLAGLARQRVRGKPFTVTEYQHPSPNYYGAEGPLLLAAYAGLQDWDGLWFFDYGPGNDSAGVGAFRGFFDTAQHPTKMASLLLAAALFRRGDIQPAAQEHVMAVTPDTEVRTIVSRGSAWSVMNGAQLGVPGKLALASRLSLSVGTNASGLAVPPAPPAGNVVSSDTGELRWDLSLANRGAVTVNATRAKAVIGFGDQRTFDLGGVVMRPGTTQLGWSVLGLSLTRGDSFTNEGAAVLIAAGQVDNTGMVWKDATRSSVGSNWGRAPVLAEVVPFELTLPVSADRVKVSALDERGQRRGELTVTSLGGRANVVVTTNAGTVWYEVLIGADTPFDRWRFAHFTAAELADPAVSGEYGIPAGDAVPNLLKYAHGLPPKVPWSGGTLTGELDGEPPDRHLAIRFTRRASATDLSYAAEVSPDLALWESGPLVTEVIEGGGGPGQEIVTVRDRQPVAAASRRFMRLKVSRLLR